MFFGAFDNFPGTIPCQQGAKPAVSTPQARRIHQKIKRQSCHSFRSPWEQLQSF